MTGQDSRKEVLEQSILADNLPGSYPVLLHALPEGLLLFQAPHTVTTHGRVTHAGQPQPPRERTRLT